MALYQQIIDAALARLGPGFAEDFDATTDGIPYPVLDGRYAFTDPTQAGAV
jgi:hypothetical protein